MICSAITRQGYINIMLNTEYGDDMDVAIGCPSHVVPKLEQVELKDCSDCKECWIGVLSKVKFREEKTL